MVHILIGTAAGLLIAAAGLTGFILGIRHSADDPRSQKKEIGGAAQQQDALMKKYEAILDYDPYGEHV